MDVSEREPDLPQETNRVGTKRKIGVGGCSRTLCGDRRFHTSAVVAGVGKRAAQANEAVRAAHSNSLQPPPRKLRPTVWGGRAQAGGAGGGGERGPIKEAGGDGEGCGRRRRTVEHSSASAPAVLARGEDARGVE